MRTLSFALLLSMPVAAAPVPKEVAKRTDAEIFVGVWETAVSENAGQPHTKARWTFDAKLKMVSNPHDGGEGSRTEWAIRIDPAARPKQIDIGDYKGIYEIDGADIKLVYTLSGERPTDYKAGPGKYYSLLRRVEKK